MLMERKSKKNGGKGQEWFRCMSVKVNPSERSAEFLQGRIWSIKKALLHYVVGVSKVFIGLAEQGWAELGRKARSPC
jgi:hypothetical protein